MENYMNNKIDLNINKEDLNSQDKGKQKQGFLWDGFEKAIADLKQKNLADRFVVPPFSILNTQQGYWQDARRDWLSLGIESERGRVIDEDCNFDKEKASSYKSQDKLSAIQRGRVSSSPKINEMFIRPKESGSSASQTGISIFDPLLCELAYKWFCPKNGYVLDVFAGGSVRGIVAEFLDYKYTGIELRPEQVKSNQDQAERLNVKPTWIVGDSFNLDSLVEGDFDLIFSCPPYHDLEVYSDLPGELSAIKDYRAFIDRYTQIIKKATSRLKNNRFACFVVGNIRGKDGYYHNFVGDTISAFASSGMGLYNDAILINSIGSLPVKAALIESKRRS